MAKHNNKPIVVINHKAEVLGVYDSIKECIEINGFPACVVYHAAAQRFTYRGMMFISQEEHREHWENGTLHLLQFGTKKERLHNGILKTVQNRSAPEIENRRRRLISEKHKKLFDEGKSNLNKAIQARKRPVMCIDTGQVFPSVSDAAAAIQTNNGAICRSIRKGYRTRGVKFKYVENNED